MWSRPYTREPEGELGHIVYSRGRSYSRLDRDLASRDKQLQGLHQQLNVAKRARQKQVVRDLEKKITRLGQCTHALQNL